MGSPYAEDLTNNLIVYWTDSDHLYFALLCGLTNIVLGEAFGDVNANSTNNNILFAYP